jgi:hypothetical protein
LRARENLAEYGGKRSGHELDRDGCRTVRRKWPLETQRQRESNLEIERTTEEHIGEYFQVQRAAVACSFVAFLVS